jgi:hypothetical protein
MGKTDSYLRLSQRGHAGAVRGGGGGGGVPQVTRPGHARHQLLHVGGSHVAAHHRERPASGARGN